MTDKTTRLILQGGGRMSLVLGEGATPNEVKGLRQAIMAHADEGLPITMFAGISEIVDNRPMNEQNLTKIITADRSSGKYHTRYIEVLENGDERVLTDERCQADQSGSYEVLEAIPESADRNTLCGYCWPPVEVEREYTAGPV